MHYSDYLCFGACVHLTVFLKISVFCFPRVLCYLPFMPTTLLLLANCCSFRARIAVSGSSSWEYISFLYCYLLVVRHSLQAILRARKVVFFHGTYRADIFSIRSFCFILRRPVLYISLNICFIIHIFHSFFSI